MNPDTDAISFGKRITDGALRAQYTSVTVAARGSPPHGCRIILPKSAIRASNVESQPIRKGLLSLVAGFQVTPTVLVQVLGTVIEFEVNLVDWLGFEMERRGAKIEALRASVDANGQVVHANVQGPGPTRGRVAIKSNGPNVILLAGQMPEDAAAGPVEILGLAAASLDLTSPLHQRLMEPLVKHEDPKAHFSFLYPKSWSATSLAPPSPQIGAVEIRVASKTDTLAYIRVHSDASIAPGEVGRERIKNQLIAQIEGAGVKISSLEALAPLPEKGALTRFAGEAKLPKGDALVAVAIQPAKEGWMGAMLISPGRGMNPLAWMRAKRAFEIVTASLSST